MLACTFRKTTCVCWIWFSSAFPGLIIQHYCDQLFQCSSTFLARMNAVKVRMLYFYFFFPVRPCFLISACQVETPNKASPLPSWFYPQVLAAHLCLLQLSDPSLVYSSVILLSRSSAGPERKGNKKACWKHWKRGLEERNVRRWVGVGKRTSTAKESEQTTYLFSLKR